MGKEREEIASSVINLVDDPHLKDGLATVGFDDEGVATEKTYLIKDGKLDKEALKNFEINGGHEIVAPTIVGRGAAWAIEILWDELTKDQDIDLSVIPSMSEEEKMLSEKIKNP